LQNESIEKIPEPLKIESELWMQRNTPNASLISNFIQKRGAQLNEERILQEVQTILGQELETIPGFQPVKQINAESMLQEVQTILGFQSVNRLESISITFIFSQCSFCRCRGLHS
jgi:hypothetical protein